MATAPQHTTAATQEPVVGQLDEIISATERKRRSLLDGAARVLGVESKKVLQMLRNVWKVPKGEPPLTDDEMFVGVSLVARFELDPIARDIYVTRRKTGELMTVIGLDGWIRILDRTEHYDGYEQEFGHDANGQVEWLETRIYSKKRSHPIVYRAFAAEYKRVAGPTADKLPVHMLGIFSLRHAARRFVPLGCHVMTEEEAEYLIRMDSQAEAPEPTTTGGSRLDRIKQQVGAKATPTAPSEPVVEPTEPEPPSLEEQIERALRPLVDDPVAFDSKLRELCKGQDEETKDRIGFVAYELRNGN